MATTLHLQTTRGRQVDIVVHPTRAHMRKAANAWSGGGHDSEVQGVTHGFTCENNPQAIIRLNTDDLTRRVIDHELVHASQAIYGHDFGQFIETHPLEHWTHHNETFAYIFTELQELTYTALAGSGIQVKNE